MKETSIPRGMLGYLGWLKATGLASPLQETLLDHIVKVAERTRVTSSNHNPAKRKTAIEVARNLLHRAREISSKATGTLSEVEIVHDGEPRIKLAADAVKL